MDFDRVWRLFGDRFEQRHRLLVLSRLQPQASQQPARGEIVWTDHCRAFEIGGGLGESLRGLAQVAQLQVGVEIVRIELELPPIRALGGIRLTEQHQGAAVDGVGGRQPGIQLQRRLELGLRGAIVVLTEVRDAEQQMRLGRLPGPEDAVHVLLPADHVVHAKKSGAEEIGEREVAAEQLLARLQQRHQLFFLAGLQVAVAEHQVGVLRLGIGGNDAFQLRNRFIRARRLVVRQREIQTHGVVEGVDLQRRFILLDCLVVLTEPHVGGAEIRQRVRARRRDGERRLVGVDGSEDVAGLVQLEPARQEAIGVRRRLGLRERRCRLEQQRECENQKSAHRESRPARPGRKLIFYCPSLARGAGRPGPKEPNSPDLLVLLFDLPGRQKKGRAVELSPESSFRLQAEAPRSQK